MPIPFHGKYTKVQDFLKDWARIVHGWDGTLQTIKGGRHIAGGVAGTIDPHDSVKVGDQWLSLKRDSGWPSEAAFLQQVAEYIEDYGKLEIDVIAYLRSDDRPT